MVARSRATAASIAARLALYSALPVLRCDSILSMTLQTFVAEYDSGINGLLGIMVTTGIDPMSEPGETRTLDPRIKSALLYRLSYRLIRSDGNQTVNQHRDAMPRCRRAHDKLVRASSRDD